MKSKQIRIICENEGRAVYVEMGTSLLEILHQLYGEKPTTYLAAYVNNKIKELSYIVYEPVSVLFIDITHFEGHRVYERTLFFTLNKAIHDLWGERKFYVRHSVSRGFYSEISGFDEITPEMIAQIKGRMTELIAATLPIERTRVLYTEAEQSYARLDMDDKIALLKTRPRLYVSLYTLGDIVGYFYGALAPSTASIGLYDLRPYYKGMYIAVPKPTDPTTLNKMVPQNKMFDIFQEYKRWNDVVGVANIGQLNTKILAGEASDLIKMGEGFHEKKLASIADTILDAHRERGAKLVLMAGPSSSGKTTTAKRIAIQLRILGLTPVLISLDDYFVERDKTPRDENGEYDYEAFDAIDHDTFNSHLSRLVAGESVDIPRYDFITGRRMWHEEPLRLDERSILIVEGIHALNPRLTESLPEEFKFHIYLSCLTSVSMDNLSRIPSTDNRLIRRMVRDSVTRGNDATATLQRWQSVRRGEEKYIFPYQERADVMFNSALFYEIPVLKDYVVPLLRSVPNTVQEYGEAQRLLKLLDYFVTIPPTEIRPTSILREFIGGSSFKY
ncbi:MAG: nucleoside kinase [Rikenellaceae bacterium]|jgi:uridine kinase|nr:nucleoside kinase [Rikenellaceae bacterium]